MSERPRSEVADQRHMLWPQGVPLVPLPMVMFGAVMGFVFGVMAGHNYPAALGQRMTEQHQGFKLFVRERVLAFHRGEMESVLSLQASIKDFLMVHESGTDKQLADWIREDGSA